ncbi:MAG TPA: sigma-70 family RNA polymerase sigma factor [Clostridiales bacterium]|jgi:RNA polymerase sigma-B factor|nr:sigma-70 family RNA polymerase sigma factor [Clostridiales bacterium]
MEARNYIDYTMIETEVKAYISKPTEESMARILHYSTPLIRYFASRLSGGNYSEDLVQCGYEGVIKALSSFDPDRNVNFATYASHWILGEIRHYIRREARYYRPRFIEELRQKAEKLIEDYYMEKGEIPSQDQLSEALNISKNGLSEVMRAGLVSMDQLDLGKISSTHYESFKLPIEDRILLYSAIKSLSDIKQKVIYYLFYRDYTQQQTAECLGLNQRMVSRLLKSSISDLKAIMAAE